MLNERKLTAGELKKRDEIVKAIKRDRKEENLTDEEVYAIATAQAKKTNEGVIMDPYERLQAINEALKGSEDDVDPTKAATDYFEDRYGILAKPATLRELSKGLMAKKNPKRASMAKQLLDMLNKKPEADLRDDRKKFR